MKRTLAIILSVLLLIPAACADDYSAMTYDELLALREAITAEIMSRPEWKEVTVPVGSWIIGKDIPAGSYSIRIISRTLRIYVYKSQTARTWDRHFIVHDDDPIGQITLDDGMVIELDEPCIFSRPDSLGF